MNRLCFYALSRDSVPCRFGIAVAIYRRGRRGAESRECLYGVDARFCSVIRPERAEGVFARHRSGHLRVELGLEGGIAAHLVDVIPQIVKDVARLSLESLYLVAVVILLRARVYLFHDGREGVDLRAVDKRDGPRIAVFRSVLVVERLAGLRQVVRAASVAKQAGQRVLIGEAVAENLAWRPII